MLLSVKQLRGGYGDREVCRGIDCTLNRGEIMMVVGPNGCGKTTFFRLLLGFLPASGGDILLQGDSVRTLTKRQLARRIAYIPQYHTPAFSYTALEVVLMGRASYIGPLSTPLPQDRDKAFAALELLGILELCHQSYNRLSGGQRQMVLLARAICQDAEILVMDEPGANLDYVNNQLLIDVICQLAHRGYGIVLSTHSPAATFRVAHKVLLLHRGEVAAFGPPHLALTSQSLEQVYGIEMDVLSVTDRYHTRHTLCLPVKDCAGSREL